MTTRERLTILFCVGLIAGLAFVAGSMADDSGNGSTTCASGQWVHATVTKANGEKLSVENRRDLPDGYSTQTSSGDQKVTVNSDGSVQAEGGDVAVECLTPTK